MGLGLCWSSFFLQEINLHCCPFKGSMFSEGPPTLHCKKKKIKIVAKTKFPKCIMGSFSNWGILILIQSVHPPLCHMVNLPFITIFIFKDLSRSGQEAVIFQCQKGMVSSSRQQNMGYYITSQKDSDLPKKQNKQKKVYLQGSIVVLPHFSQLADCKQNSQQYNLFVEFDLDKRHWFIRCINPVEHY